MWDLPGPGLEPVSPALAGRFSTTAPPGKPSLFIFNVWSLFALWAGGCQVGGREESEAEGGSIACLLGEGSLALWGWSEERGVENPAVF